MKKQVVAIHGGEKFNDYETYLNFLKDLEIDLDFYRKQGWRSKLPETLGDEYDVLLLKMPNPLNAQYEEWKIVFSKVAKILDDEVILVGHSLGGVFLMKYLSENSFPKKIKALFSVAAPFYGEHEDYSLGEFTPGENLDKVSEQADEIFLIHSKDDLVVPFSDFEAYKRALPKAKTLVFENRNHFSQEEFPEIIDKIRKLK